MKPIILHLILGRVATKADGSLSLNFSTSELSAEEQTVLFKLCRINLQATLKPLGETLEAPVEVKSELSTKTPSSRLRNVFFVLYRQKQALGFLSDKTFEQFYADGMEKIISDIKDHLEPE